MNRTRRTLTLTALLSGVAAAGASGAPLAADLPAGALVTLETHGASPTFGRLTGLLQSAARLAGDDVPDLNAVTTLLPSLLDGTLGREASAGLYSVGTDRGGYTPALLAVTRVTPDVASFLKDTLPRRRGAAVGRYTFTRSGSMLVGMSGGLLYAASDKTLLMGYLGRLSGRNAPRLNASPAYTRATGAVGPQELGVFLNFSAAAKVARAQLGRMLVPRLLSPLVDALDTLGQYAAGFHTTEDGLQGAAASVPNAAGKDVPLYGLLTHTTDFAVQGVVPASAESVTAAACAPGSSRYLARWLTRVDLLDPSGFLTDSQIADHLERQEAYLGDECAQVTLAGSTQAALSGRAALAVTYRRVTDRALAERELPLYAASYNAALQGVADQLQGLVDRALTTGTGTGTPGKGRDPRRDSRAGELQDLFGTQLRKLRDARLVYAFQGDYLVTASSEAALAAALDGAREGTLADDADFRAANLVTSGVPGWTYARAGDPVQPAQLLALLRTSSVSGTLTTDELVPAARVLADLVNRYGGMTSQSTFSDGVILSRSTLRYAWK
ncbi:hypothetical protein [Deinococcus aquiradiocola]|uniref:Uncharacterized protein n=1 Tax=Deinococcus aquiradiocola TaxID=393059 RepID=A0A917PIZ5_9DEIO|nr:hypothetical protein [Deinococcus aquiradiocola]GGJ79767.1 hypothetical protein GCM10008939_24560 [Deinococcus aquiradiocola]